MKIITLIILLYFLARFFEKKEVASINKATIKSNGNRVSQMNFNGNTRFKETDLMLITEPSDKGGSFMLLAHNKPLLKGSLPFSENKTMQRTNNVKVEATSNEYNVKFTVFVDGEFVLYQKVDNPKIQF